jgi:hypothetical protein
MSSCVHRWNTQSTVMCIPYVEPARHRADCINPSVNHRRCSDAVREVIAQIAASALHHHLPSPVSAATGIDAEQTMKLRQIEFGRGLRALLTVRPSPCVTPFYRLLLYCLSASTKGSCLLYLCKHRSWKGMSEIFKAAATVSSFEHPAKRNVMLRAHRERVCGGYPLDRNAALRSRFIRRPKVPHRSWCGCRTNSAASCSAGTREQVHGVDRTNCNICTAPTALSS